MKRIDELILELGLENTISLDEIPTIDLYMDQVTQLFENTFNESKRNDNDKVLTKTMINNYAKGKLLFPIKNKKYSREHIMLISLIYLLKGALSINDVKTVLDKLNKKVEQEQVNLEELYNGHLTLYEKSVVDFKENIQELASNVNGEIEKIDDADIGYLEQVLFVASLVNASNMYRRLAEKIIDQLNQDK